jgi:hypothetical protein
VNITLKNIPPDAVAKLKKEAQRKRKSLNSYIAELIQQEAEELERVAGMKESLRRLERIVATIPPMDDSVPLIREDRDER